MAARSWRERLGRGTGPAGLSPARGGQGRAEAGAPPGVDKARPGALICPAMAMIYPFAFEPERALASLLYVAARLPRPTLHGISKIFYFADKRHLWKYGRLMFGDQYVAMENGPVPSAIYDMLKAVRDDACVQSVRGIPMEKLKQSMSVTEFHVTPLQNADTMKLSESNEECMDWAIEEYGNYTFGELIDRSHDETWAETAPNGAISVEAMTIGVKNREALLEYLRDPFPGTAEELTAR